MSNMILSGLLTDFYGRFKRIKKIERGKRDVYFI